MKTAAYRRGIEFFNSGAFFDAHEAWEEAWREAEGLEKKFLQALVQVAVAFHHHSSGNLVGACSVIERARKNLAECPTEFGGIDLIALLESLAKWQEAMSMGGSGLAPPKLEGKFETDNE